MATATLNEPVVAGNPVIPVEALTPVLYKDVPVLTTALLSAVYGTTQTRIRENYRVNRDRFTEGKHLFKVSGEELRALKECVRNSDSSDFVPKTGGELTLWTARGAARHAKMLNTDKAWDVFELLEENYFSRRPAVVEPAPPAPLASLTPSQQQELQNIVAAKSSAFPKEALSRVRAQLWSRLHNKFKVAKYDQLPAAAFPEAVEYLVGLEVRGAFPAALPEAETPKALPPLPRRASLDDYRDLFRALPESPAYWDSLRARLFAASEVFAKELAAIHDEATKPFRVKRKHEVRTYFDAAIAPIYCLLEDAEQAHHMAYRSVYHALEGCQSVWRLLRIG